VSSKLHTIPPCPEQVVKNHDSTCVYAPGTSILPLTMKCDVGERAISQETLAERSFLEEARSDAGKSLGREVELLLICARALGDGSVEPSLRRLLRSKLDWPYLIATASQHGLLPVLCQQLQVLNFVPSSESITAQLDQYFRANTLHNLFLSIELLKLLEMFATNGIRAVAFKGPLLALLAYGSISLREFTDLDILIAKEDVAHAKELLSSRAYHPHVPMSETQEQAGLHLGCERVFVRADRAVALDLHWNFAVKGFSFSPDLSGIWTRLQPMYFGGQTILTLARSDLLLLLCVHGAKHRWKRLEWITSVAGLLRRSPQIDWQTIMRHARRSGAERMLFLGIQLAKDLSHVSLPDHVSQWTAAHPVVERLARDIRRELFTSEELSIYAADKLAFLLQTKERLRDKLRYGYYLTRLTLTPTSKDRALLPLPAFLAFLYYLMRPFRLVHDYGLGPLYRFLGRMKSS